MIFNLKDSLKSLLRTKSNVLIKELGILSKIFFRTRSRSKKPEPSLRNIVECSQTANISDQLINHKKVLILKIQHDWHD